MKEENPKDIEELKRQIVVQISDLSRLLGEIQSDEKPVIEARTSFLKLGVLVGRALDIDLY